VRRATSRAQGTPSAARSALPWEDEEHPGRPRPRRGGGDQVAEERLSILGRIVDAAHRRAGGRLGMRSDRRLPHDALVPPPGQEDDGGGGEREGADQDEQGAHAKRVR
jgi:hypothetical protein